MRASSKTTRRVVLAAALPLLLACAAMPASAETSMSVGGTIVNGQLSGFYLSLSNYYRVPHDDIYYLHDRHIPDYDMPVVFFISQHAHVSPSVIVDMRLSGRSWMDISLHFGLGPDVYYVPVKKVYGPPYGKAYGYYKKHDRKHWDKIRLSDDDVVNMVNLRFMSDHYNYPAEDVMRMRSGGKSFRTIDDDLRRNYQSKERYQDRNQERDRYEQQYREQDRYQQRDDGRGQPGQGKGGSPQGQKGAGQSDDDRGKADGSPGKSGQSHGKGHDNGQGNGQGNPYKQDK